MFRDIQDYEDDPIEGMFARLSADQHPGKIDLGIGVFRDESGQVPVMKAVRRAEQQLYDRELPKSYVSPLGNVDYCRQMERITLGDQHPALRESRIVSAQTPGAGSALRAAAEFVRDLRPDSVVWYSDPVWDHQLEFFDKAGLKLRPYRYYDRLNARPDFDGMREDLAAMKRDDVLLLHGCCHNPTGQDPAKDDWRALVDIVNRTGAIPFVDVAYQGFGRGIDEDVEGLQMMAASVPQMLLTVSSSKSFGIYRERAGLLSVIVAPGAGNTGDVKRKLRDNLRQLYFMPPDHGAAIVNEILGTPELEQLWRAELDGVRVHVQKMRSALRNTIESANPDFDAAYFETQHGMFSCLPISDAEQRQMEIDHHIYMLPHARVNVAAMSEQQSIALAQAFADIRAARESESRQASG